MSAQHLKALGASIRLNRQARDLSQEAFAELCDLHRTYISDVERGARNITMGTMFKIARALGTTVSDLTRDLGDVACPSEGSAGHLNTNSTRLLMGLAVLLLAAWPIQAQSLFEGIALESAIASSIIQLQADPNVSMAEAATAWGSSTSGNSTLPVPASITSGANQGAQSVDSRGIDNNPLTSSNTNDVSLPMMVTVPEPSSLLFGIEGDFL